MGNIAAGSIAERQSDDTLFSATDNSKKHDAIETSATTCAVRGSASALVVAACPAIMSVTGDAGNNAVGSTTITQIAPTRGALSGTHMLSWVNETDRPLKNDMFGNIIAYRYFGENGMLSPVNDHERDVDRNSVTGSPDIMVTTGSIPISVACCTKGYVVHYDRLLDKPYCISSLRTDDDIVHCRPYAKRCVARQYPGPCIYQQGLLGHDIAEPVLDVISDYTGVTAGGLQFNSLEGLQTEMFQAGLIMKCGLRHATVNTTQRITRDCDDDARTGPNCRSYIKQGQCNIPFHPPAAPQEIRRPDVPKPLLSHSVKRYSEAKRRGPNRRQYEAKINSIWDNLHIEEQRQEYAQKLLKTPDSFDIRELIMACRPGVLLGKYRKLEHACHNEMNMRFLLGEVNDIDVLNNYTAKMDYSVKTMDENYAYKLRSLRSSEQWFDIEPGKAFKQSYYYTVL